MSDSAAMAESDGVNRGGSTKVETVSSVEVCLDSMELSPTHDRPAVPIIEAESTNAPATTQKEAAESAEHVTDDEQNRGFQSGLGIRKALRKHWGATVKLWDDGLRDLSEKVKSIGPPTPPASSESSSASVPAAAKDSDEVQGQQAEDKDVAAKDVAAATGPVLANGRTCADKTGLSRDDDMGSEEAGARSDEEASRADGIIVQNPWSPVVRPISRAMEGAKSMGVKLVDIWDMHDIVEDVKQQRDYWRRRREEKRLNELTKKANEWAALEQKAEAAARLSAASSEQDEKGGNVDQEAGDADSGDRENDTVGAQPERLTVERPQILCSTPGKPGRRRTRFGGKENESQTGCDHPASPPGALVLCEGFAPTLSAVPLLEEPGSPVTVGIVPRSMVERYCGSPTGPGGKGSSNEDCLVATDILIA